MLFVEVDGMVDEPHLTVKQAAERLQVKDATVRRWLRTGQLHGTYLSDRAGWRVPASEVRRILNEGLAGQGADSADTPSAG